MVDILEYYSRRDVQEAIVREGGSREIGVKYGDKGFGKRPQIITFEGDIMHLAKGGATSFHFSEEKWDDPLLLKSGLVKAQLDTMRAGWDLILDIDTPYFSFAKFCALSLIEALEFYDIYSYGVKFSGRSGFHIAIPFEAFPEVVNGQPIKEMFPEGVRMVATYLKHMIAKKLKSDILSVNSVKELAVSLEKEEKDLMVDGEFDPYKVVDIDSIAIASRHMIRAPYSINEKSGLVSVVLTKDQILGFDPSMAKMEDVDTTLRFIDPARIRKSEEAKHLLIESFDWASKQTSTPMEDFELKEEKKYEDYQEAISEKLFPPCIVSLLEGVKKDGRKRSVFVLIQFLRNMAWSFEKIQDTLLDWNKKNYGPLQEGYIIAQVNWHKRQKEKVPPPNCKNESYYLEMGVCKPDNWCKNIKNPLQHVKKKVRAASRKPRKKAAKKNVIKKKVE